MKPVVGEGSGSLFDASYNIRNDIVIYDLETPANETQVSISVSYNMVDPEVTPNTCNVQWQRLLDDGTDDNNVDAAGSKVVESQSFTIDDLDPLRKYRIVLRAYGPYEEYGSSITTYYTTHGLGYAAGLVSRNIDVKKMTAGKSFLTMSNTLKNAKKNIFQTYYRDFDAIEHGSYDLESNGTSGLQNFYSTKYYSFGTKIFFDPTVENPAQGAGIGFFLDGNASRGYFLIIESTSYSASQGRNAVRILKAGDGSDPKVLYDSQTIPSSTIQAVYGGSEYAIDIKVKISGFKIKIIAYINGVKITASDTTKYEKSPAANSTPVLNTILTPTDKVGLVCTVGTAMFDYVYGSNLNDSGTDYNKSDYNINFYQGQFSNDLLSTAFGDLLYYSENSKDEYSTKKTMIDEFGTVAREILKTDIKFDSRPSLPVWFSTGDNKSVTLLGSSQTNFKGSAFVLNNTSTTVPLADGATSSFFMLGNTLADSGTLEYTTDELADYVNKEPVIFQSKWLQNESDVKSLARWIKEEVINRGQSVTMTVFGNPLISLGDIVTINYPAQGFNGEERMIVTSVSHGYDGGLNTTVTCRTINKTAKEASDPIIQLEVSNQLVDAPSAKESNNVPGAADFDGYYVDSALPNVIYSWTGKTLSWTKPEGTDSVVLKAILDPLHGMQQIGKFTESQKSFDFSSYEGINGGSIVFELFSTNVLLRSKDAIHVYK
jgi:hypothetical protein